MPLIVKSATELLQEARQTLEENTEITNFGPGSTTRLLVENIAKQQAEQIEILNGNIIQGYISRASGEFLDRIGEFFGLTRKTASYASDLTTNNFKFYIDPATGMNAQEIRNKALEYSNRIGLTPANLTDTGFLIRSGTSVGGSGGVIYRTTETARFEGTATQQFVGVIAQGLGPFYNVGAGSLTVHTISDNHLDLATVAPIILCSNTSAITNGQGLEGDEEFRFRITQQSLAAEAANETAIRIAALSVPGVNDVIIKKYTEGIGTYNIFLLGDSPIVGQGVINTVQEVINVVQALGMRGSVSTPTYLGVEIVIALKFVTGTTLADKHDIRLAVAGNSIDYINNTPIGGELIINELIQRIMDTSNSILDMRILRFGMGEYNPSTGINQYFQPLMVTNQTSAWDEKFYSNASLLSVCEVS